MPIEQMNARRALGRGAHESTQRAHHYPVLRADPFRSAPHLARGWVQSQQLRPQALVAALPVPAAASAPQRASSAPKANGLVRLTSAPPSNRHIDLDRVACRQQQPHRMRTPSRRRPTAGLQTSITGANSRSKITSESVETPSKTASSAGGRPRPR